MSGSIVFKSIVCMSFIIIIFFASAWSTLNAEENQLGQRLEEIRQSAKEDKLDELEIRYLKLLEEYDSPEQKGRIYATIAFMYSQNIMKHWAKVIKYCEKSLHYPLEVLEACALYVYWGGALEIKYHGSAGEEFPAARRQAIIPYLTGLKLVLDNQTIREKQAPPSVGRYHYDNIGPQTDQRYQEFVIKRNKEVAAREKVLFQNKLIDFREIFTSKCISLYSREPYMTDELKQLASEILKKDDGVKDLIAKVKEKIP